MTEILTESFCERCGTRYTFESSAPRRRRLGGLKVLGRGLKSFVLSDDSSLDEAIAGARSDAEREATGHQLDAFHKTFSFCMSCRQYTCANCWNEPEARCLSCAPLAVSEAEPILEAEIDPERLLRFIGGPTVEAPAAGAEEVEPQAAVDDSAVSGGMDPGQSLDDAIAAYEASLAAEPPEAAAEAPMPAEAVDDGAESIPEPAPELPAAPEPPELPAAPAPPAGAPQWPSGPRWPTGISARQAPPPSAPAPAPTDDLLVALMARTSTEAMWAASNREILQPVATVQPTPGIQSCGTCSISLSANARFCRRCGTPQR